jgi:hypothetical protein
MALVHTRNYSIQKGEIWERLITIKDKRTHRKRIPTEAAATILIGSVKYVIPVEITSGGSITLIMTANNTEWLPVGSYQWDLVAKVSRSSFYTLTDTSETLAVKGTLTVTDEGNITPMASDGVTTPLIAR